MTTESFDGGEFRQLGLNLRPNEVSGLLTVENEVLLETLVGFRVVNGTRRG